MTEPDDLTPWLSTQTNELRAAIGALKPETDERLVQPLAGQVRKVLAWCASERPEQFRRSIPVHRDDHDILVCDVIAKLVQRIVDLDLTLSGIAGEALDADQIEAKYGHLRPKVYRHGKRLVGLRVTQTKPIYIDCAGACDLDNGACVCE